MIEVPASTRIVGPKSLRALSIASLGDAFHQYACRLSANELIIDVEITTTGTGVLRYGSVLAVLPPMRMASTCLLRSRKRALSRVDVTPREVPSLAVLPSLPTTRVAIICPEFSLTLMAQRLAS